jgi:hypothetical protein
MVMEFLMLQTLVSSPDPAMAAIGHRTIANLIADDDLPGLQSLLESRRVNVDDRDEVKKTGFAQSFTHNHAEVFFCVFFLQQEKPKKVQFSCKVGKSGLFRLLNIFQASLFVSEPYY